MPKFSMQSAIVAVCLTAAGFTGLLRFLTETDFGYDMAWQIQAGIRFYEGHGLTTYGWSGNFLEEKQPATLLHFPAGFSLWTALLLYFGLPLASVTKIYGLILTLAGWWGWARFLVRNFAGLCERRPWKAVLVLLVAACLPLFTTPAWNGTDIVLWAAVPWIVMWIASADGQPLRKSMTLMFAAGLACGVACLFRYASVFLAVASLGVVFFQTMTRWRPMLVKVSCFAAGLCIPLLLQVWVVATGEQVAAGRPGGITGDGVSATMLGSLWEGLLILPAWNVSIFFWMPERFLSYLTATSGPNAASYAATVLLIALPFLLARQSSVVEFRKLLQNDLVVGALYSLSLPVFLLACMVLGSYDYAGDRRYYFALIPLVFLLFLRVAIGPRGNDVLSLTAKFTGLAVTSGFIISCAAVLIYSGSAGSHGKAAWRKIMQDADIATFPSTGLTYEKYAMRKEVLAFLEKNPDWFLLTNFDRFFWPATHMNQARFDRIPLDGIAEDRITLHGPKNILIVTVERGEDEKAIYSDYFGHPVRNSILEKLPNLKIRKIIDEKIFPAEKIKVMQAVIPDGEKVQLW